MIRRHINRVLALLMVVTSVWTFSFSSYAAKSVDYYDDILDHYYSINTTDRDRANDFILSFYNIAMRQEINNEYYGVRGPGYHQAHNVDLDIIMKWAVESGYATTALTYAANNAVGLYEEAVNSPENRRRYDANQIMIAVELMQKMSFKKIKNDTYRSFYEQGQTLFLQKFTDAGIIQGAASSAVNSELEALKTYQGNTVEFNAYNYYVRYVDLQTAIGADAKALYNHWITYGKSEGRLAN